MTSSREILNTKLFSQREATTNRESSLARNYDALDDFHVSSELPPLKGIPTQRLAPLASSRTFSGAYDSCATARSAAALDLGEDITSRPGTRDEDRPLSRHKPVSCGNLTNRSVSTPTLTHSRAFARHRSAITAASTMDLGAHAPSVAESFADYTSRVAPATKKMHAVDREGVASKVAQVLSRPSSAGRLLSAKLSPLLLPEGRLLPEGKGALAGFAVGRSPRVSSSCNEPQYPGSRAVVGLGVEDADKGYSEDRSTDKEKHAHTCPLDKYQCQCDTRARESQFTRARMYVLSH